VSTSRPTQQISCPDCGAELQEDSRYCWLCGLAVREGVPAAAEPRSPFAGRARGHIADGGKPVVILDRRAGLQFSLATIMLSITLVAVLLGVFRMAPGLGIGLAILVTPAFLRTCIVTARRKARGESISLAGKLGSFAVSFTVTLGMVILLAALAIVSIFVALNAICAAMMSGAGAP